MIKIINLESKQEIMSIDIEAIFKVIAYGVPALLVLGGIVLLLLGYLGGNTGMIDGGWVLTVLGVFTYIIEIVIAYLGD
jgi:hypothetical protein